MNVPTPVSAVDAVLTPEQRAAATGFRRYAAAAVAPFAAEWDRQQHLPDAALAAMAAEGFFGATIPAASGGKGWDAVTFGLLHEALGRHDSALTGYLTVQAMVGMALAKWGTTAQKERWLPPLARGEVLASFALTEPQAGSDFAGMTTELVPDGPGNYRLTGEKRWISGSQRAGLFLVFARLGGAPVACLVPRAAAGLEVEPIRELMGFRAAGLGRVRFSEVPVTAADLVGKPGFAFSHVAPVGLHYGRISTACSALGLLRGCAEASATYAAGRKVGGQPAAAQPMVQSLIARMVADANAAAWLCWAACAAEDRRSAAAYTDAFTAKYFASRACVAAASDAIQIHGAAGVHESAEVSRFYRCAKIMEIIEGTTQVHEAVIAAAFRPQR